MAKKLLIVESPAKAKTLSKYLGPDYIIRATYGHFTDLALRALGVNVEKDFQLNYELIPDKLDKIAAIVEASKMVDEVIIASDPDREGEAIAWHVANHLKKTSNVPYTRATFGEITPKAVKYAVTHTRNIDENMVSAQQARRAIDRLVGFIVSPYLSKKLNEPLSAGRVQSVAVRIITEREEEIESFIPEVYYSIEGTFSKDSNKFTAKYSNKVTTEEQANKIKTECAKDTFKITSITSESKKRYPLPPLTTSKLQQEASAKFKMATEKIMAAAQALYEAGLVSYIRTDSTRCSDDAIENVRAYLTATKNQLPKTPNLYKNKDGAQDAHEAIRPTDVNNLPQKMSLEEDQRKVYDLIWTMFVASQMTPAIYDTVTITITSSSGHVFVAEGSIQRDAAWMTIASAYIKKTKDVLLPNLNKNDQLKLSSYSSQSKKTSPPSRFKDGHLINELERREIGRPSTYATIISKIINKKYVSRTEKGLEPTQLGRRITQILSEFFSFMDFKYTAKMEKDLDNIAEGNEQYLNVMSKFFSAFKVEFQTARGSEGLDTGIACPKCGDKVVVRKSPFGYFGGCVKYPECKGIVNINIDNGKVVQQQDKPKASDDIKCPKCESDMYFRTDGNFGPYYSCVKYPRCFGKRKYEVDVVCPKCNKNKMHVTIFDKVLKLACSGYPDCKNIIDLPEGMEVNWTNPEDITPPVFKNVVEKILKKNPKSIENISK